MSEQKQLDFTPGRWAVYASSGTYSYRPELRAYLIESQTNAQLKCVTPGWGRDTKRKVDCLLTFSKEEDARAIVQKAAGISGEMNRRITAAHDWAQAEVFKLLESSQ